MAVLYYIVPRNEFYTLKELRVSTQMYNSWSFGPESGVIVNGAPIEDLEFNNADEAYAAIAKYAPQHMSKAHTHYLYLPQV